MERMKYPARHFCLFHMTNRYIPSEDELNYTIKNARAILNQFFNHVSDMDVHFFRNALKARRDELNKYNKEVKDEQPTERH